jgi:hypothetical protein
MLPRAVLCWLPAVLTLAIAGVRVEGRPRAAERRRGGTGGEDEPAGLDSDTDPAGDPVAAVDSSGNRATRGT